MLRKRRRALGIALIIAGLLLLAGVVYLGLHYWLLYRPFELYPSVDPLLAFKPREIDPATALLALAGQEDEAFEQALNQGELETAYVTLAFASKEEDARRMGRWLLLAHSFAEARNSKKALISYGQAYKLAVLSPIFSDFERAEALLMIAEGLVGLRERDKALFVYDQAALLVTGSPYLKEAQRVSLASYIKKGYRSLGAGERLSKFDESLSSLPKTASPLEPTIVEFATPPEEPYSSPDREKAALALAKALKREAKTPPKDLLQALAEALKEEDAVRVQLYEEKIASEERLSHRAGWLWEKIHWLTLKYRVAVKGFGISIVPEWEDQAEDIRAEIGRTYETLYTLYAEEVVALPEQEQVDRAWVEIYRDGTARALLGLYTDAPLEKLAVGLEESMNVLANSYQGYALRIKNLDESPYLFAFQPIESGEGGEREGLKAGKRDCHLPLIKEGALCSSGSR